MNALSMAGLVLATLGTSVPTSAAPGDMTPVSAFPVARQAKWSELVPANWNPRRQPAFAGLAGVRDGSPQAMQMLAELRSALNNAPTNPEVEGVTLQLIGYLVPLDEVNGQLTEFLLVPYFGACIHVPPPPSNQIVHVTMTKAAKGLRSMDVVRVTGTLQTSRLDTDLGSSAYTMRDAVVDRP